MASTGATLLTPEFQRELKQTLDKRFRLTPVEVWQSCLELCFNYSVAPKSDVMTPTLLLVSAVSRVGLVLSHHRLHTNGLKMYRAGADLSQLTNAVAIELKTFGNRRECRIKKNEELMERCNGLIALVRWQRALS